MAETLCGSGRSAPSAQPEGDTPNVAKSDSGFWKIAYDVAMLYALPGLLCSKFSEEVIRFMHVRISNVR